MLQGMIISFIFVVGGSMIQGTYNDEWVDVFVF